MLAVSPRHCLRGQEVQDFALKVSLFLLSQQRPHAPAQHNPITSPHPPAVRTHPIESNYTRHQIDLQHLAQPKQPHVHATPTVHPLEFCPQQFNTQSATRTGNRAHSHTALHSHSHQPCAHALSWVGVNSDSSQQLCVNVARCMRSRQTGHTCHSSGIDSHERCCRTAALQAKILVPKVVSATANACRAVVTQGS